MIKCIKRKRGQMDLQLLREGGCWLGAAKAAAAVPGIGSQCRVEGTLPGVQAVVAAAAGLAVEVLLHGCHTPAGRHFVEAETNIGQLDGGLRGVERPEFEAAQMVHYPFLQQRRPRRWGTCRKHDGGRLGGKHFGY